MDDARPSPVLHSRPAHEAFGWCARCPGHDLTEEVGAWRTRPPSSGTGSRKSGPRVEESAPPGHSVAGHRVFGWCALCPGRSRAKELTAWRAHDQERHAVETFAAAARLIATVTNYRTCPVCDGEEALTVVTVNLRTLKGTKRAGCWAYCLECEAVPTDLPAFLASLEASL